MLKIEKILLNDKNENVLEDSFEEINVLQKWIIVKKNGKKGLYCNDTFEKFFDCEWDKFVFYEKGILVTKNGLQGFFDYEGKLVLEYVWKKIEVYPQALVAYRGRGAKRKLFDYNGNLIEE